MLTQHRDDADPPAAGLGAWGQPPATRSRWVTPTPESIDSNQSFKALCERVVVIAHGQLIYDGGLRDLVQRFADDKALTVELERPIPREALAEIGDVLAWDGRTATIRVPREDVSARAAQLLARFPVLDLAIQEPDVDEVIRALFSGTLSADGEALTPRPPLPAAGEGETRQGDPARAPIYYP